MEINGLQAGVARTKRVCKHPNLLFKKWLSEWKDEAEKRGSNMKFNFHRALKSLEKYPVPIYTGKECLVLANFGEKICKLLDKRIEEHIKENGPINWNDYIEINYANRKPTTSRSKKVVKAKPKTKVFTAFSSDKQSSPVISKKSNDKSCSSKTTKGYIPSYRSGAYGLLVGLYIASQDENYPGYLKKQEVIDAAQDLSDASFIVPPTGSHYTAFSSMSTLIKKGLAVKEGNPARYSLTETGNELAVRVQSINNINANSQSETNYVDSSSSSSSQKNNVKRKSFDLNLQKSPTNKLFHNISESEDSYEAVSNFQSFSPSDEISFIESDTDSTSNNFPFSSKSNEIRSNSSQLDSPAKPSCSNMNMDSLLEPEEISLLSDEETNSNCCQDNEPNQNQWLMNAKNAFTTDLKFTYVDGMGQDASSKEQAFVNVDEENGSLQFLIKCKLVDLINSNLIYNFDNSRDAPPAYTYAFLNDVNCPELSSGFNKQSAPSFNSLSPLKKIPPKRKKSQEVTEGHLTKKKMTEVQMKHTEEIIESPPKSKISMLRSLCRSPTKENLVQDRIPKAESKKNAAKLFAFPPKSFKVVLCVDNMEVAGGFAAGKRSTKDIIIHELNKNNVDLSIRKLSVGDFLWVCQEIGNTKRELVLPFVVERKRMDDLASSIRDGRFKEQKFRLKQSGLCRPIYLVEETHSASLSLPLPSCRQACTNTSVVDGFNVKYVSDQKESAAYLTVMTRYLQSKFQTKTINAVTRENLPANMDMSSNFIEAPVFEDFNSSSVKNRIFTVQEMFTKHLIQLFGMSVDRASAVIQMYPTPRSLMEALDSLPSSLRDDLFCGLRCPKSGRNIPSSVSCPLARLYYLETLK